MPEHGVPRLTVRYNGIFDFDGLYSAIIDWAKNYGYMWYEKTYKHKVPRPTGAEQEFDWIITRNVTEYIQYEIKLSVHTWDQRPVEVEVEGKKKQLTSARLFIVMTGKLITDWQKRFGSSGRFGKFLGEWYEKLYGKNIGGIYGDTLMYRMLSLQSLIKRYFDLQTKKHVYKGYLKDN